MIPIKNLCIIDCMVTIELWQEQLCCGYKHWRLAPPILPSEIWNMYQSFCQVKKSWHSSFDPAWTIWCKYNIILKCFWKYRIWWTGTCRWKTLTNKQFAFLNGKSYQFAWKENWDRKWSISKNYFAWRFILSNKSLFLSTDTLIVSYFVV